MNPMKVYSRRCFLQGTLGMAPGLCLTGCGSPTSEPHGSGTSPKQAEPSPTSRTKRVDQALTLAARYLIGQQLADGAWRSELKGPFKDGGSLTPLAVHALHVSPPNEAVLAAGSKGADYLAAMVQPDGTIDPGPFGLSYPVYTAALSVLTLSETAQARHRRARDAWLSYLRARQLTEDLGWRPADKPYGGWGFCSRLPRKPAPDEFGPPLLESNLSATTFALAAMRAAGCDAADPAFRKALVFIKRCQNYGDNAEDLDPRWDDGGFFFIYDDPVRNKAGVLGKDATGRDRFHSYGSTTADGLRALLASGLPRDDARVLAARRWLETNFDAQSHPGTYALNRKRDQEAVYYYYSWSMAQALKSLGVVELRTKTATIRWAEALVDELLRRQEKDGSWINASEQVREDDPLVATPLAMAALATCRSRFTDETNSSP